MSGLGYVGAGGAAGGQAGFDHWMKTRLEAELEQKRQQQQEFENQLRLQELTGNQESRKLQQEQLAEQRAQAADERKWTLGGRLANTIPGGTVMPDDAPAVPLLAQQGLIRTRGDINRGGPAPPTALAANDDKEPVAVEEPGTLGNSPARPGTGGRLVVKLPSAEQQQKERDDVRADAQAAQTKAYQTESLQNQSDRLAEDKKKNEFLNVQLSEEAKNMAADKYAAGGGLPPGSGAAANANRVEVQNRAAIRHPGISLVLTQAGLKADTASLTSMTKMHDAVRSFERTADANGQVMLNLAKKLVDANSPYLNTPIREFEQATGNKDLAAFNVARKTVVSEYAKILNSPNLTGQLTEGQQREIDGLISGNMPLGAIISALSTLQLDAKNREDSTLAMINEIQTRIKYGGEQPPTPTPDGKTVVPTPQLQIPTPSKKKKYNMKGELIG